MKEINKIKCPSCGEYIEGFVVREGFDLNSIVVHCPKCDYGNTIFRQTVSPLGEISLLNKIC